MVSKSVTITNAEGLNLRPAGVLCELAVNFSSKVTFKTKNNYEANAKSVLSVLGACVRSGETIELICDGSDEEEAMAAVYEAVSNGLGA